MSSNHNGHAVPVPGSTLLHVAQSPPRPQQPQPAAQPVARVATPPIGAAPQQAMVPVQSQPQPQIQLAPLGMPTAHPAQAPQPGIPNPLAGVGKVVQENKRELLFAGAGAFLATMFANGGGRGGRGGGRT